MLINCCHYAKGEILSLIALINYAFKTKLYYAIIKKLLIDIFGKKVITKYTDSVEFDIACIKFNFSQFSVSLR